MSFSFHFNRLLSDPKNTYLFGEDFEDYTKATFPKLMQKCDRDSINCKEP